MSIVFALICADLLRQEAGSQDRVGAGSSQESKIDTLPEGDRESDVIVTGIRPPGSIDTDIEPLERFTLEDLQKMGVGDARGLLRALGSRARSADGSPPITVINGRAPTREDEVYGLPIEAFQRIDLFPEQVATKFGYPATRKVLNFATKPWFRATQFEQSTKGPSDGEGIEPEATVGLIRIRGERRLTLSSTYMTRDEIRQADRNLGREPNRSLDQRDVLSLLPREEVVRASGSIAAPVGRSKSGSISGSVERRHATTELGFLAVDPDPTGPESDVDRGLQVGDRVRQITTSQDAKGTAAFAGYVEGWGWNVSMNARHREIEAINRTTGRAASTTVASGGPSSRERITSGIATGSSLTTIDGRAVANGVLAELPAGSMTASFALSAQHDAAASTGAGGARVRRSQGDLSLSLHLPLATSAGDSGGLFGDLSLDATLTASTASRSQNFLGKSVSGRWSPMRRLQFSVSGVASRTLPDLYLLASPQTVSYNVPYFDFIRGQSVPVTTISGGDPLLKPTHQRVSTIAAEWKPFPQKELNLNLRFNSVRNQRPVGVPSALTSDTQQMFPELFSRDEQGVLQSVTLRPVNFASSTQKDFSFGVQYSGALGTSRPATGVSPRERPAVFLSIQPTWRLEDSVILREGFERVDLLRGGSVDGALGRPQFLLNSYGSINYRGIGVVLTTDWQGSSSIIGSGLASDLSFSSLAKIALELSVNAQQISPNDNWARNLSFRFVIDNLLNDRLYVVDKKGATPYRYQSSFLDPVGRSVGLKIKKLF